MKKKIEKKDKKKTNNFPQNTSYKTANLVIGTLLKIGSTQLVRNGMQFLFR
jgi:hypothetical protein